MIRKLVVKSATSKKEEVVDIEDARDWDYYDPHALVVVENQLVRSYQELLDIASSDSVKGRDILDVHFMVTLTGG